MSGALLRLLAPTRASWRLLSAPRTTCIRLQRAHISASAAANLQQPPSTTSQLPAVEPPPVVPYSPEACNSVAISGTVLTEPQLYRLSANQVMAHCRLGLRPRFIRPHLPQQPQGAVSVDAWGLLGLQLAQHVAKGARIQVRGVLREDQWTDKATGEQRRALKIIAEELALLEPSEQHQQHLAEQEQQAEQPQASWVAAAQLLQQDQQQPLQQQQQPPLPQPQQQPAAPAGSAPQERPRLHYSAEQSRRMYEDEGAELEAIAAQRGLKLSTVIDHMLQAAAAGSFSSWQRLASDVQLGPVGASWLSPAEVAEAAAAVAEANPMLELAKLPLKQIRQRLEEGEHTAGKVAQLVAARAGDPVLLYGCIKLVLAMLDKGISFSLVSSPPRPAAAPAPQANQPAS